MELMEIEKFTLSDIVERERDAFGDFGPHHRLWLHRNAPRSVHRWLEKERARKAKGLPAIIGMRQGFASFDTNDPSTMDFGSRNTFTTEASIIGAAGSGAPTQAMVNQWCQIFPNDIKAGKEYKLKIAGTYGTTGTPTIVFTPRWGNNVTIGTNVSLGASQTITTGSGIAAQVFWLEFDFTIRSIGFGADSSNGKGHGIAILGGTATVGTMGKTSATIDTSGLGTAGCGLQMGVTWGTSSASNLIIPEKYEIQSQN